jgi:hypothetical protein
MRSAKKLSIARTVWTPTNDPPTLSAGDPTLERRAAAYRRRARSSRFLIRLPQTAMLHQFPCWLRERS